MKQYEKYKPSGLVWLDDVPEYWEMKRIKDLSSYTKGKTPDDLEFERKDGFMPYLSMEYLRGVIKYVLYAEVVNSIVVVDDNEIILLWDGSNAGEFVKSQKGILASTCAILNKIAVYNQQWYYYCLKSSEPHLQGMTKGMGIPHVDGDFFRSFELYLPPLSEQTAIATYLDEKTANIDRRIELLHQKIDHFKQLRRSLISQVVTRGLNPNVKLKSTGIDWLGDIPEHWRLRRVKEMFGDIGSGSTPKSTMTELYDDNGYYWLQSGDLNDNYVFDTKTKINDIAIERTPALRLYPKESLVIAMYGATIGKLGVLGMDAYTNQACCVMSEPHNINTRFLFYELCFFKPTMLSFAIGGGQPNISQEDVKFHLFPLPPLDEQNTIAIYLDEKTSQIDTIVSKCEKQIEQLTELRRSLISQVVTGQFKVC